jgi:hypothetical protein
MDVVAPGVLEVVGWLRVRERAISDQLSAVGQAQGSFLAEAQRRGGESEAISLGDSASLREMVCRCIGDWSE